MKVLKVTLALIYITPVNLFIMKKSVQCLHDSSPGAPCVSHVIGFEQFPRHFTWEEGEAALIRTDGSCKEEVKTLFNQGVLRRHTSNTEYIQE